jgi:hypothetical protein
VLARQPKSCKERCAEFIPMCAAQCKESAKAHAKECIAQCGKFAAPCESDCEKREKQKSR